MKIGVFDSGIGGLSVARAVERSLPEHEVIFRSDVPEHFPYAMRSPAELFSFVLPVFDRLIADGCAVIVVACNTVSTTLIAQLRDKYDVPLVAVEPMLKFASEQTKTGVVIVCATPTTLGSQRYAELKQRCADDITVLEPDCSDWSTLIERNEMTEARIRQCIEPALEQAADMVVLGCTHYHWIEADIQALCIGKATVLQPEAAIVAELERVLRRL